MREEYTDRPAPVLLGGEMGYIHDHNRDGQADFVRMEGRHVLAAPEYMEDALKLMTPEMRAELSTILKAHQLFSFLRDKAKWEAGQK